MTKTVSPLTQFRYRLLSHLPGRRGLRYLHKFSKTRRDEVNAAFDAALAAARGRICIDLGANLGVFTTRMAEVAQRVHAFEPDPWTAQELRKAVAGYGNVEVIEAAAGTEPGRMPIYRSARFETDQHKGSLSSTLLADKSNVTATPVAEVEVMDFCAFLQGLDSDVALIKIDIEGAEVALLERLLDDPVAARIDHIFVETHETRVPRDLALRSLALRRRVRGLARPRVDMDWM